jgi:hypothetical protein
MRVMLKHDLQAARGEVRAMLGMDRTNATATARRRAGRSSPERKKRMMLGPH